MTSDPYSESITIAPIDPHGPGFRCTAASWQAAWDLVTDMVSTGRCAVMLANNSFTLVVVHEHGQTWLTDPAGKEVYSAVPVEIPEERGAWTRVVVAYYPPIDEYEEDDAAAYILPVALALDFESATKLAHAYRGNQQLLAITNTR